MYEKKDIRADLRATVYNSRRQVSLVNKKREGEGPIMRHG